MTTAPAASGALALPDFLEQRDAGLMLLLPVFPGSGAFRPVIDALFVQGYFLRGIDYPRFLQSLYALEPGECSTLLASLAAQGESGAWRIAQAVERMDPGRTALYRQVRISGDGASYLFEPLAAGADVTDAETGGDGQAAAVPHLDFDEFVAQLWLKEVRAGIDEAAVRTAIDGPRYGQIVVARDLAALPGQDASVEEVYKGLHRSDAPRRLEDGRVDLTVFANRFPRVTAGTVLVRKQPCRLGHPGRSVRGQALVPPMPRDLDLGVLAGTGVAVRRGDGDGEEVLCAEVDGFLDIDGHNGKFSISDHIVHREGVSLRTTGDLALGGENFEEHGDVLEQRELAAHTISVLGNVYGRLLSRGGDIHVAGSLSGGQIDNPAANVEVGGTCSGGQILAPCGDVTLTQAGACLIVARRFKAAEVTGCEILADEVEIGIARGCRIAARHLCVEATGSHRGNGTVLMVRRPDCSALLTGIRALDASLGGTAREIEALQRQISVRVEGDADLARYLKLNAEVQAGRVRIAPAQNAAWQTLGRRWAPVLRELAAQQQALRAHAATLGEGRARLTAQRKAWQEKNRGIGCTVNIPDADLVLRLACDPDGFVLPALPATQVRQILRQWVATGEVIPVTEGAALDWTYQPPAIGGTVSDGGDGAGGSQAA